MLIGHKRCKICKNIVDISCYDYCRDCYIRNKNKILLCKNCGQAISYQDYIYNNGFCGGCF